MYLLIETMTKDPSRLRNDRQHSKQSTTTVETHFLPMNFQPGSWDVICQRGRENYDHDGNKRFREIIEYNLEAYQKAVSKNAKGKVVSDIVSTIRAKAGLGGFVKKDLLKGKWFDVGDKLARDKVGQALRDGIKSDTTKRHDKPSRKFGSDSSLKSDASPRPQVALSALRQMHEEKTSQRAQLFPPGAIGMLQNETFIGTLPRGALGAGSSGVVGPSLGPTLGMLELSGESNSLNVNESETLGLPSNLLVPGSIQSMMTQQQLQQHAQQLLISPVPEGQLSQQNLGLHGLESFPGSNNNNPLWSFPAMSSSNNYNPVSSSAILPDSTQSNRAGNAAAVEEARLLECPWTELDLTPNPVVYPSSLPGNESPSPSDQPRKKRKLS